MNADILLTKAKSQLTTKYPYFGMLASKLKHEANDKVKTYASNGVRFLYNEEFIQNCTKEELFFILRSWIKTINIISSL